MHFLVTVEKRYTASGKITVEAETAEGAVAKVDAMINGRKPLQTIDPRIEWGEPEFDDGTFRTTGDVD